LIGGILVTARTTACSLTALIAGFAVCATHEARALTGAPADAEPPAVVAAPGDAPAPQESFLSSLKQAFQQDYDHAVIRGHFDLGSPPDTHRYYCLVDTKTGKSQPNGVSGQPLQNSKLGGTGIKVSAVSVYSCASAEQQGILQTSGYTVNGVQPVPHRSAEPVAATRSNGVDVAGVKLGMSPDEVRAVLKSKHLFDYSEEYGALRLVEASGAAAPPLASVRYLNVVAAWTPAASVPASWESYEVMFTPVPGKERVMAIIHSSGYAASDVLRETALQEGLVKKYGGFANSRDMPPGPTWRVQSDGSVQVGDPCGRRAILGGLKDADVHRVPHQNLALKTTPEEFAFQIERCGAAVVTEDHAAVLDPARNDRVVTQVTVTAYSPSIGIAGATAAGQLIQNAAGTQNPAPASAIKEVPTPNL
jgi:hypothetical protein